MLRDKERIGWIQRVLSENNWDALVCALPSNVLLLSGYWPVIGSAVAIITREGAVTVLAPEDERELAEQGWADEVRTFEGGSLHNLNTFQRALRMRLAN
jgi:Xaa-Pro aminopeptidase